MRLTPKIFGTVLASGLALGIVNLLALGGQPRVALVVALAAVGLSAVSGGLLAYWLEKPIAAVRQGMHQLTAGRFSVRLADGELAEGFNHLAASLERAEESRRQWAADVSHEFRTPLAVLRAELEAIQDGVREANPAVLGELHAQVMGLIKLTDDLFMLNRADLGQLQYRKQKLDLADLLGSVVDSFRARYAAAGLDLRLTGAENCRVYGDPDRLRQLCLNLLENSLRYTDVPGQVEVGCGRVDGKCVLLLEDSAPGVPPEQLDRVFDRFFRVERSRSKKLGGSGLGLPICQKIAEAHGGSLRAKASALGGLRLELALPESP